MRCLLLHGIGGSPFETAPLAEALAAAGFEAHAPALPGHGGTEEAYLASSFALWRDVAQAAARGELPPPAGLLALATPLFFHKYFPFFAVDWRFFALPLWARLQPVLRVPERDPASRAVAPWQGHEQICCLRHFAEVERALPAIRRGLPLIRAPLCIVQLRNDTSCRPYNAFYLARHCGSLSTHLHLLRVRSPHGGHLPMTHRESRQRVAELAVAFAREVAGATKACTFAP